jgi:hypothetical protein
MIHSQPALLNYIIPPCRVNLIARHDNMVYNHPLTFQKLIFDLLNAACDDRQTSKTLLLWNTAALAHKITMADMNGDPLRIALGKIREEKWKMSSQEGLASHHQQCPLLF